MTKEFLSESVDGQPVLIAATASPGTLLHTATSVAGAKDEVYLYLHNGHTSPVLVTVQWGGTTSPNHDLKQVVPSQQGAYLAVPAWVLAGGLAVRAYAGTANVVNVMGYVHHIVP
jgi:hypothetical protein